jgi:hypothetical protein
MYDIQVERPGQAFRDQILGLVRDRREKSDNFSAPFKRKLPELYDLWRGVFTGRHAPTKNDVHIPLIYSTIWSDVARKMATSFSQYPYLMFQGYGPDDAPNARKHEALVSAQLKDADVIEKEVNTFLQADLYGTAVSKIFWDHKEEIRNATEWQALPLSGERVRRIIKQREVTFDGPNYANVDLIDFFPQPGFRNVKKMYWAMDRYYLDFDEVQFMASEAGGKVFDAAEVARMKSDASNTSFRTDESLMRRFEQRTGFFDQARMADKYSRPVEIIEMWGYVPTEFAGRLGGSHVVITIANDKYVLRMKVNPYHHMLKPYVAYSPTPDPHYFFAPGKAEVGQKMQIVANRFVNQQLDGADLLVHPMWVYDRNKLINTRNLIAGPGRIFGVNGDPSTALAPVPMDLHSLGVGGQMVQMLWSFIQMGSGVQEDTIMGGGMSKEQTAREFMGRREASGSRLAVESVLYENNYLEPMGNYFESMNAQLLEVPRQVLILGDAATTDPVTGSPIQMSREEIQGWDLVRSYSARAIGSATSISKDARTSRDMTMFQILAGAQPGLAGAFNMVNFLRQMLRNFDYQNVNELIQKQPTVQDMLSRSGLPQAGQIPEEGQLMGVPGASSGPLTIAGGLG